MRIRPDRFNIYLLCLALLACVAGCRSPEGRRAKQLATLHVHLEVNRAAAVVSEPVSICRANPIVVNVMRDPILTEGNVAEAKLIGDSLGGFVLQVQFDKQGAIMLEQYSAMNPGMRLAIHSEFGEKALAQHRWLASPVIPRRVSNGVLTFTPDATRDESEQIVLGLNNVAIKNGNQTKPKKSKSRTE